MVAGPPVELADVGVAQDHWESACQEHPFEVPLSERGDLLVDVTATMKAVAGVGVAHGPHARLGHREVVRVVAGTPHLTASR